MNIIDSEDRTEDNDDYNGDVNNAGKHTSKKPRSTDQIELPILGTTESTSMHVTVSSNPGINPEETLYNILMAKNYSNPFDRQGLATLKNSLLKWNHLQDILQSVDNDKDLFESELRERLELESLSKPDAFDFAIYLTNIAFSPQTMSSVAQDMINCVNELELRMLDQDARYVFEDLVRMCDYANSLRSTGDVKFNPFQLEIAIIPLMSRSPQVCEVFDRIQNRSDYLSGCDPDFGLREVICSVAGPGSGKTHFLNCLVNWNDYKDDILSALKSYRRSSQEIIDMVENENLMTCGASFTKDCKVSDDELSGVKAKERFWLRILFQEMCKAESDFNSFRLLFLQDPKLICLLCSNFIIPFIRKRNGCEYVLLLIDDLISCLENADADFKDKAYYLADFLGGVGYGQFYDKKLSLFTTSLWHSPIAQFFYPPHNFTHNIQLPNMKDVAIDITNRVHEISNGSISLSDGLMLATSVAFHPRAIEQLMIFAGDYSSHSEEEEDDDDILTAFSNQLYKCGSLSWECPEAVKLIYPAIFLTRLDFTKGEFRDMGLHMLNSVDRWSVVPFLSPIHLFQRAEIKKLVRLGLNITKPKGFEKFIANWMCFRYNMYDPRIKDDNRFYAMSHLCFILGTDRTSTQNNRDMEACDIPRLSDLHHLEPIELSCRVYVPESNSDEGIDLIAFYPKEYSRKKKMIVVGIQNKIDLSDSESSSCLCSKEILESVLKSTESLLYWQEQGHDVYLWIPCWKDVPENVSEKIKSKLNRASEKWEVIKNDTTTVEMMLGLAESDIPMTLMTKEMANFAGRLAAQTIVSDKEDLREKIFGQSTAWFMDGGELAFALKQMDGIKNILNE